MPTTLLGGQIIGGVGGRIWIGNYLIAYQDIQEIISSASLGPFNEDPDSSGIYGIDVAEWRLSIRTNLAQCPHTGTFGANCRRIVLNDWSFSASTPLDQSNFPDMVFASGDAAKITTHGQNVSVAFKLGDVTINPEAVYMGIKQSWYYAPSAYLQAANPVLNAAGDVIRMSFSGEGSGHIFLLPEEKTWCDKYIKYLGNMGWN